MMRGREGGRCRGGGCVNGSNYGSRVKQRWERTRALYVVLGCCEARRPQGASIVKAFSEVAMLVARRVTRRAFVYCPWWPITSGIQVPGGT